MIYECLTFVFFPQSWRWCQRDLLQKTGLLNLQPSPEAQSQLVPDQGKSLLLETVLNMF